MSVLVFVWLSEAMPGRAKLGEKLEICASSYGVRIFPVNHFDPDGKNIFQKNGFDYEIGTIKGVVIAVLIQKSDRSTFTNKEKETILLEEGGKWKKDLRITNTSVEGRERADGATAIFFSADESKSWVTGCLEWPSMAFRIH